MSQASIWESVGRQNQQLHQAALIEKKITFKLLSSDLENALLFYKVFFDTEPVFQQEGLVRFEMDSLPFNLIMQKSEKPNVGAGHFGLQVKSSSVVRDMAQRLEAAGFKLITEAEADCCYALQTKIWAADPDGYRWEIFVVTEAETENGCGPDCICHADFERTVLA